jgi:Flp pilus assembly protein TadB
MKVKPSVHNTSQIAIFTPSRRAEPIGCTQKRKKYTLGGKIKEKRERKLFLEKMEKLQQKKALTKEERQLNFGVYFLLRYVLFSIALVTLQHLHKLQVVVVFGMQMIYFLVFGRKLVKQKIFDKKFEYFVFFIQEIGLTSFLLVTLVHQFNKKSFDESQEFIIEMV